MAELDQVPMVEVNNENLSQVWPGLILAIRSATYIAVDTELSGLGNRKLLNAKVMDDRYHHMCDIARTRSIVALGISCFKLLPPEGSGEEDGDGKRKITRHRFQAQSYNIMLLCTDDYMVEAQSLQFLVAHGFDFNLQYAKGVQYRRGNDKEKDQPPPQNIRAVFSEIVLSRAPLVLHNALVDLVFLYHNLFAALPTSQQSFIMDLSLMFPAGLYDTKYVTDFKARLDASYLEYVFKRCQRGNYESSVKGWSHMEVSYPPYTHDQYIVSMPCASKIGQYKDYSESKICMQYRHHGWCPESSTCTKSHDINVILDFEDRPKLVKSEEDGSGDNMETENSSDDQEAPAYRLLGSVPSASVNKAGSHRAGFDAFMTGYIFAFYSARYGEKDLEKTSPKGAELGMEEYGNKLYLVGKDIPLQITKSSFAKPSKSYKTKMAILKTPETEVKA